MLINSICQNIAKTEVIGVIHIGITSIRLFISIFNKDMGWVIIDGIEESIKGTSRNCIGDAIQIAVDNIERENNIMITKMIVSINAKYVRFDDLEYDYTYIKRSYIKRIVVDHALRNTIESFYHANQNFTITDLKCHHYILDDLMKVKDPIGLTCSKFTTCIRLTSLFSSAISQIIDSVSLLGIEVVRYIPSHEAAALAYIKNNVINENILVINLDTLDIGAVLCDAQDIIFACYIDDKNISIADKISQILCISINEAEDLLKSCKINVSILDEIHTQAVEVIRNYITDILESIFEKITSFDTQQIPLIKRLILTGAGAHISGITEFITAEYGLQCVIGIPINMPTKFNDPNYMIPCGMIKYISDREDFYLRSIIDLTLLGKIKRRISCFLDILLQ